MHNKIAEHIEVNHANRSIRKSKSSSNISSGCKKKINNITSVKIEVDVDHKSENNKSSPIGNKADGNISPNHRRRSKRSSITNNSYLSTVASVHELMTFVIYKDNPPTWLKQTELYKEYTNKSKEINIENLSSMSPLHYHQQSHRKQRCNLHMYARSRQSWQSLPTSPILTPPIGNHSTKRNYSNESIHKTKREMHSSPIPLSSPSSSSSMTDLSMPLDISVKSEPTEQTSTPNKSKALKQSASAITTRRQQMLCKKKIPQNDLRGHQRMNSVENQELSDKKDSSSSSQNDSYSSTASSSSSSIEHTSPSPTTTVSGSSSHHSSPTEYMRGNRSIDTRLSSPLRIQTSISPHVQSLSTPQRRSTRIWAPSNFYIDPMWIIPPSVPSKRLLVQNTPPSPSITPETSKRPRRKCRS